MIYRLFHAKLSKEISLVQQFLNNIVDFQWYVMLSFK